MVHASRKVGVLAAAVALLLVLAMLVLSPVTPASGQETATPTVRVLQKGGNLSHLHVSAPTGTDTGSFVKNPAYSRHLRTCGPMHGLLFGRSGAVERLFL